MHAQRGKNRRGVEEHRHVRRRGQLQAFGDEEELQTKQRTGQQAAAPRGADLIPAAFPADQQSYEQCGNARPPHRLHDRCVRCRAPPTLMITCCTPHDQAQPDHHLQGKSVGATPAGAHRDTSHNTIHGRNSASRQKPGTGAKRMLEIINTTPEKIAAILLQAMRVGAGEAWVFLSQSSPM